VCSKGARASPGNRSVEPEPARPSSGVRQPGRGAHHGLPGQRTTFYLSRFKDHPHVKYRIIGTVVLSDLHACPDPSNSDGPDRTGQRATGSGPARGQRGEEAGPARLGRLSSIRVRPAAARCGEATELG